MSKKLRQAKARADAKIVEGSVFENLRTVFLIKSDGGHDWIDHALGRVLVQSDTQRSEYSHFAPLERHGLFMRFAGLEPTEASFKEFADEHGLLTGLRCVFFEDTRAQGELWETWLFAHGDLRRAVRLWKQLERGRLEESLKRHTIHKNAQWPNWTWYDGQEVVMSCRLQTTDYSQAANLFLEQSINVHLASLIDVRMRWEPATKKFQLHIRPQDLLTCLWWQFAREVLGEVRHVACKVCERLLEIGSGAFTSAREFCSSKCKQKDHREKVKQAKELHAKGVAVKSIAKRFSTSPETIQHWLTKVK